MKNLVPFIFRLALKLFITPELLDQIYEWITLIFYQNKNRLSLCNGLVIMS